MWVPPHVKQVGMDSSRPTTILHAQFGENTANPDLMNSSFSSSRTTVSPSLKQRLPKPKVARELNSAQRPMTSIPEQNDEGAKLRRSLLKTEMLEHPWIYWSVLCAIAR